MEIRFSLPTAVQSGGGGASSGPPAASSSESQTWASSTQAGTYQFPLDSRTRHTRRSSKRAKTGCSTCKKRHVKCDETRPACLKCVKWRGYCDGYTTGDTDDAANQGSASEATPRVVPQVTKSANQKRLRAPNARALAPLSSSLTFVEPVRFISSEQHAYFQEWSNLSVEFLSGGLSETKLWTTTLPQLTFEDPTLRLGAMAIGALWKSRSPGMSEDSVRSSGHDSHFSNAVTLYCQALLSQARAAPTQDGLRTALLSSVLFICFESLRGNTPAALKHILHGFAMLNELAGCTDQAPGLVRIAQAPPSMVEDILDVYKPLEMQSRSFMGSYRKFFYAQNARRGNPTEVQGRNAPQKTGDSSEAPSASDAARSLASPPFTEKQTRAESISPARPPLPQTGIPSPESSASPQSRQGSQVPPMRPPGIPPFTRHTPYFRPKITHIHSLDHLPQIFTAIGEAQAYWVLVQRQMVKAIPLLTMTTAQLALHRATDDAEFETKISSIRLNPRLTGFIDESRYWLHRWEEAFNPLYNEAWQASALDPKACLEATNLRLEYLILEIYTSITRFSGLEVAEALTPRYREINVLAETLLTSQRGRGFAMDGGWSWQLFLSAFACRDHGVSDEAIRILAENPMRNALRDSLFYRAIALKNREVELASAAEGTEAEHWLRLRRRELVFEDFGAHVIMRSSQKNLDTGGWELIEEIADFASRSDGKLLWKRQPVTDAASILAGVC